MKGILMKEEMILAIISGRKTQTRRIIKSKHESGLFQIARYEDNITEITSLDWNERPKNDCTGDIRPKYKVGEVIYVKEGYAIEHFTAKMDPVSEDTDVIIYKQDHPTYQLVSGSKWKNAMFMPASAARTFLKITNVRVEKLGDITAVGILSEGVGMPYSDWMDKVRIGSRFIWEKRQQVAWRELWTKINKSYDPDQWIFVYEFKVVDNPKL